MGEWVVSNFLKFIKRERIDLSLTDITFLGYTFKENCSDTRNTKVRDIIFSIKSLGANVGLWDPLLDVNELDNLESKGILVHRKKPKNLQFVFLCVQHDEILKFLETYDGTVFNYKKIAF